MPKVIPVTTPVDESMCTTELLALHIPPDVELERVIVKPAHTLEGPEIAGGIGRTFIKVLVLHPVGNV